MPHSIRSFGFLKSPSIAKSNFGASARAFPIGSTTRVQTVARPTINPHSAVYLLCRLLRRAHHSCCALNFTNVLKKRSMSRSSAVMDRDSLRNIMTASIHPMSPLVRFLHWHLSHRGVVNLHQGKKTQSPPPPSRFGWELSPTIDLYGSAW